MFDPFTVVGLHTWISIAALALGVVVVARLFAGSLSRRSTALYLGLTVATCVSGFILPAHGFMPSHATGILALAAVAVAAAGRYVLHLRGPWRAAYVVALVVSLYAHAVATVAQMFLKIPALARIAPTQGDPAFIAAQTALLVLFVLIGVRALRAARTRPGLAAA